ncbi:MAG TPA: PEP-utilizing enzyme, partial [Limnochordia bacterium]|nr:PEP-utilizing enzyme [Limnochordia bacterium]
TWMEDPTPIWRNLQEHLRHPEHNPEAEQARLAAAREKALAAARAQIAGYPKQVIEQFEYLLKAAQDAVVLSEDHGFYIDFCGSYQIRRLLLEFGRRFVAAGVLADGDDIMLLTPDEIVETARRLPHTDRKELVQERRREMQHFAALPAPPVLGTLPPAPPPDNPMARAIGRFFGTPPQETGATDLLQGHAGSPGVVSGIARVVATLDEAQRVKPGEILVAPTTAPPWTPLFGSIAAIVTDTGGVLSHSAVVAREYGIPAVVGALRATRVIRDGQRIEVDGRAGTVRVLASEAATA